MQEDIAVSDILLNEQEWFSEEYVVDLIRGLIIKQND